MNKSLAHRGPDAEGFHLFDNGRIVLGQRRLSIIDTSPRSNQPMHSSSGQWSLIFNGEIYNYLELRSRTSYEYKTDSDTEVILAYVEQYGFKKFLNDCNGMFAICLYNTEENYMLLARDRMGVKPLYYYTSSDLFIFSSEIKGVLESGLVKATFNEEAVDEYLGNRYVRAPHTFFVGISQLLPGHILRVETQDSIAVSDCGYWTLPEDFNFSESYNETDISLEFDAALKKAVKMRLVSDVPLGAYLSGGVDSSIITALTTDEIGHNINTYTIGFPELNEFEYARMVAERYSTNHHEILIDNTDYFSNLNKIILFKDAPLGVPNEVPLALMSKELKKRITVVLSGEGADELLGGYGRIFRSAFDYSNHGFDGSFYDYFISLYEYVPRSMRDKYLNVEIPLRDSFDEIAKSFFSQCRGEESVFRFFHSFHVQGLLQRVDTTTMLASVEARVPFLDYELIEYSYKNIPYDLKLRWKSDADRSAAKVKYANEYSENLDTPKYLLKKMAKDYLPLGVIDRKKVGFPVPLDHWMTKLVTLANLMLRHAPWLKGENLDELIADCSVNSRTGQILWMFINLEIFRKLYFEKEWRY